MKLRHGLLAAAAVGLAPVLITVTNRAGDSTWLVPAALLPILLLGQHWPSPWSLLMIAAFWMSLLGLAAIVRRSSPGDRWRGLWALALLSLASPALFATSLALLSAGFWLVTPSWCGAAAAAWALFLLYLTWGLSSADVRVWLLRLWLVLDAVLSAWVFLFGALAGLCC
jgi:hypothetical protein